MTKKQYEGKMRQLQHNCVKQAKATGQPIPHYADRINRPDFGFKDHAGKPVNSYGDMWNVLSAIIKNTPLSEGIEL